jgi:hypothetical protein
VLCSVFVTCTCSDIDYVEFQRQGGGVISSSVRTFDLLIKQRSNNTVSQEALCVLCMLLMLLGICYKPFLPLLFLVSTITCAQSVAHSSRIQPGPRLASLIQLPSFTTLSRCLNPPPPHTHTHTPRSTCSATLLVMSGSRCSVSLRHARYALKTWQRHGTDHAGPGVQVCSWLGRGESLGGP